MVNMVPTTANVTWAYETTTDTGTIKIAPGDTSFGTSNVVISNTSNYASTFVDNTGAYDLNTMYGELPINLLTNGEIHYIIMKSKGGGTAFYQQELDRREALGITAPDAKPEDGDKLMLNYYLHGATTNAVEVSMDVNQAPNDYRMYSTTHSIKVVSENGTYIEFEGISSNDISFEVVD